MALDMWDDEATANDIIEAAECIGVTLTEGQVRSVINRGRRNDDPRAKPRKTNAIYVRSSL